MVVGCSLLQQVGVFLFCDAKDALLAKCGALKRLFIGNALDGLDFLWC